jgi:hypothetical protein
MNIQPCHGEERSDVALLRTLRRTQPSRWITSPRLRDLVMTNKGVN